MLKLNRAKASNKKKKGQSTVEYILLLVVVMSIASAIFKGAGFNRIFGPNGTIATEYRKQLEFSYRHGFIKSGAAGEKPDYGNGKHESYRSNTNSRFFSAQTPYP